MNKNSKKLFPLIIIFLAAALIIVPEASAATTVFVNIPDTAYDGNKLQFGYKQHPTAQPYTSALGQTITVTEEITVNEIGFYVFPAVDQTKIIASTVCDINAFIFQVADNVTAPTTAVDYYAESTSYLRVTSTGTTISSTGEWRYWHFNNTILTPGSYFIGLSASVGTLLSTNQLNIAAIHTNYNNYNGYVYAWVSSHWGSFSTYDLIYSINYNSIYDPEATPDPSASATPTPTTAQPTADTQITEFTDNMINYLVPLCLLLLPAIVGAWALGKSGAAKWGFIAGLNIGAILSYLYLDAFGIWAVIIIIIVDVVMIFASSRGE